MPCAGSGGARGAERLLDARGRGPSPPLVGYDVWVPKSRILMVDVSSDESLRIAPDSSLRLSSAGASWEPLVFEHQYLPPTETPDIYMTQHLMSIQIKPPAVFERRGDGGGKKERMVKGDVWFKSAGAPGKYAWEASEVMDLALEPAFVSRIALESFGMDGVELVGERGGPDPQLLHMGLALQAELLAGCPGGRLYADSVATAIAAHLISCYGAFPLRLSRCPPGLSARQLRAMEAFVRGNLAGDLSLSELARAANLSPYHFARSFKLATGTTPHRYVIQKRVEEAKRLLEARELTVDEVAWRVGFSDRSHLARHFRRLLGAPPGTLRGAAPRVQDRKNVPKKGKDVLS